MRTFFALLIALPEIWKLIQRIEKQIDGAKIERKVKEDFKVINEAFEKQDSNKLNKLFNS